jgi:capsular polysaccharide biosynthesis protein
VLFPQFEPNVNQLGFYPRGTLRPVQRRLGTLEPSTRDLVLYLQRRERRAVVDEEPLLAAVKEALAGTGLGLHVLCDASDPGDAEELVRRARIVLGPHGGAFANLVFAQPGTKVIEFVPRRELVSGPRSERLSMYYGLAQAASLDYWFVEPTRFDYGEAGILVDAEEVAQLVRRLASDGSGV